MKHVIFSLSIALFLGCNEAQTPVTGNKAPVSTPASGAPQPNLDRDNTGVNVRDRNPAAKTPIDQNENKADVQLTAEIRKRVVDTEMSVDAHNSKIITQDGHVTLRGPVKSEEESRQIEKIATDVAGAGKVTNELEVKRN